MYLDVEMSDNLELAVLLFALALCASVIVKLWIGERNFRLKRQQQQTEAETQLLAGLKGELTQQDQRYQEALHAVRVLVFDREYDRSTYDRSEKRFWELHQTIFPIYASRRVQEAMQDVADMLIAQAAKGEIKELRSLKEGRILSKRASQLAEMNDWKGLGSYLLLNLGEAIRESSVLGRMAQKAPGTLIFKNTNF